MGRPAAAATSACTLVRAARCQVRPVAAPARGVPRMGSAPSARAPGCTLPRGAPRLRRAEGGRRVGPRDGAEGLLQLRPARLQRARDAHRHAHQAAGDACAPLPAPAPGSSTPKSRQLAIGRRPEHFTFQAWKLCAAVRGDSGAATAATACRRQARRAPAAARSAGDSSLDVDAPDTLSSVSA